MLTGILLSSCGSSFDAYKLDETVDSSKGSVGYEIFTGSFSDSNDDGTGDLKGVENRLDYLEKLGIKRIWLTPVMKSRSYHKYDVDDYYSIDSKFGTLADFDSLVTAAKAKGIDVIIDLVLNHSSSHNQYFLDSAKSYRDGERGAGTKADWYCWSDTKIDGYQNFNSTAFAYYESRFSGDMPEFNLDNEEVRAEIKKIVSFWINDRHVDGFRLDATTYYYYGNVEKNVTFLTWLGDYIKSLKKDAYVVGEAWETDQRVIAQYASSGLNFFNFPTSENIGTGFGASMISKSAFSYYPTSIQNADSLIRESSNGASRPAMFITNHDQSRWGNYYAGHKNQDLERRLTVSNYLLSPGTPWMYYGEEIAMTGAKGASTDAPIRQGMVWGKDVKACTNPESYVPDSQVSVGALDALEDSKSLLSHYRKVINVRNKHADLFEQGVFTAYPLADAQKSSGLKISYPGKEYLLISNAYASSDTYKVDATSIIEDIAPSFSQSSLNDGKLTIQPYSTLLLET